MDPNATLEQARKAYNAGEFELAADLYTALDGWFRRGGFQPDWKAA